MVPLYIFIIIIVHVITDLVVAPWDDPIQDDRGKATKVATYDIQDFWKNSDVTLVKDTDTSDSVKTLSPRGIPITKIPKNEEGK